MNFRLSRSKLVAFGSGGLTFQIVFLFVLFICLLFQRCWPRERPCVPSTFAFASGDTPNAFTWDLRDRHDLCWCWRHPWSHPGYPYGSLQHGGHPNQLHGTGNPHYIVTDRLAVTWRCSGHIGGLEQRNGGQENSFCFIELIWPFVTWVKTLYRMFHRDMTTRWLFWLI